MAYLRSQERMVHQSVADLLETQLTLLGWTATDVDTLPFGATVPVTLVDQVPTDGTAIAPNTVSLTEGAVPDDVEGELGCAAGGLWSASHTFFVDVYGESSGVAKALTSDLRAVFTGRLPGTSRTLALTDYSQSPPAPAPGHLLSFEDVEVDRPTNSPARVRWEVVKLTCVHLFNATEGASA